MSSDATKIETVKGDSAETGQPKSMAAIKPVPKDICERIYAGWDGETLPTPPTTSTIKPFEKGDIFLSCTYLNNPHDNHAGVGRIVQYDRNLQYKGVLWIGFTSHLIVHLRFAPDGTLWGCDCQGHHIVQVKPSGALLPETRFADVGLASPCFLADGTILLADYFKGNTPPPGTCIRSIPGTNGLIGQGKLYQFTRDGKLLNEWTPETAPEPFGFKGITHMTVHPSEEYVTYTTETGKRVMRFNIRTGKQMPDLKVCPGETRPFEMDRNWAIAVAYLRDGRLLLTRGETVEVLNEAGDVLREYRLPAYGWAMIQPGADQKSFVTTNFFTGMMAKVCMESGEILGMIDSGTGVKDTPKGVVPRLGLAGVAEYPG
jgi:hypothetical protein